MSAFVDTNVVIRHLTGDPPDLAQRATAFLRDADELLLADIVVAECVYVLESFYEVAATRVAELMRSAIAMPAMQVVSAELLLRALELYERERLDFADAYIAAAAEITGVGAVASFDRGPQAPAVHPGDCSVTRLGGTLPTPPPAAYVRRPARPASPASSR